MSDASHAHSSLQKEECRLSTFGNHRFIVDKKLLAKAGFYYTRKGDDIKCFDCNLEVDAKTIRSSDDIAKIHKEKSPECLFAQGLTNNVRPGRSKIFMSYDSLRFEKERLDTFIDWPIEWLHPAELAADGFYYLRTDDHCACIFCRGIVGAWDMGDTPRGQHQLHFPHCPFIQDQPVGNVPISHSNILAMLPSQENATQNQAGNPRPGFDVCGTPRHMAGSYPECRGSQNKGEFSLDEIGLPQYSGPKHKDFLTTESRTGSFAGWPERVSQIPTALADAGFFYCGLSDHVRCFHCGNGLRNWEKEDIPWNEHARWYPDCSYVLLKKGQDFIDKVHREKPPYIRTAPAAKPTTNKATAATTASSSSSYAARRIVSDQDLDWLMDLDIVRSVLGMGFPTCMVRAALRDHVQKTGMPFKRLEPCIEAVLKKMEEEARQPLRSNNNIGNEAVESQIAKIQDLHPESGSISGAGTSSSTTSGAGTSSSTTSGAVPQETAEAPSTTSASEQASEDTTGTLPTLPPPPAPVTNISDLPTIPRPEEETTEIAEASSSPATQEITQRQSQEPRDTTSATTPEVIIETEEMEVNETGTSQESRLRLHPMEIMSMAEEVLKALSSDHPSEVASMAEEVLKALSSGPPSLGNSDNVEEEGEDTVVLEQPSTSGVKKDSDVLSPQFSKELAYELERIRKSRMCKVCMDVEMDVVFLPCAHMVTCTNCAVALTQCPICRKDIRYTIKPIVS